MFAFFSAHRLQYEIKKKILRLEGSFLLGVIGPF